MCIKGLSASVVLCDCVLLLALSEGSSDAKTDYLLGLARKERYNDDPALPSKVVIKGLGDVSATLKFMFEKPLPYAQSVASMKYRYKPLATRLKSSASQAK